MRIERGKILTTIANTAHRALHTWFDENKTNTQVWADTNTLKQLTQKLLETEPSQQALLSAKAQVQLRKWLNPIMSHKGYQGFFVVDQNLLNRASSRNTNIGLINLLHDQNDFFNLIWSGEAAISLPLFSDVPITDKAGNLVVDHPTMFVGAPILDHTNKVLAALLFRIDPSAELTAIMQNSRIGKTGEVYAFDQSGRLISESRFDQELRTIGLISSGEKGILNIEIRNPGVNLVSGEQTNIKRSNQPLTRMAIAAIKGQSGYDIKGYRDYRGVKVIGAWLWDKELGFGIAAEIDLEEVSQTHSTTRIVFLTFAALSIMAIILLAILFERSRQKLARAKHAAEAANEAKSAFMSAMSHELPTPLNAVIGFGEMALSYSDQPLSSEQRDYVERILIGGRSLLSLVEKILSFTELTDRSARVTQEVILVKDLIGECSEIACINNPRPHVRIETEMLEGPSPSIKIDLRHGREIINNLLSNAVLYNQQDGTVLIGYSQQDHGLIRISVSDTGQGIEPQYWQDMFQPFKRFKMENSAVSGTGVGLAIAKNLTEINGGQIGFISTPGQGSTFWVAFPAVHAEPSS